MNNVIDTLDENERHLLRVCFERRAQVPQFEITALACEAISAYASEIRKSCTEDQGNPDGEPGTVGHDMQLRLAALKLKVSVIGVERDYGSTVVAVAFDHDGSIYDHCFNWQTAQNFALHEGLKIIAVADDGHMTKDEIQRMCDSEKAAHDDCFGITN